MKRAASTILTIALLFAPAVARAGVTGTASGRVIDTSGAPVANATVVASSPTSLVTTRTNAKGFFVFLSLTPDVYTFNATAWGLRPASVPGIAVFADQTQALKMTLYPGVVVLRDFIDHPNPIVRSGVTSDIYTYGGSILETAAPSAGNAWLLHLTPGVTTGPGGQVVH